MRERNVRNKKILFFHFWDLLHHSRTFFCGANEIYSIFFIHFLARLSNRVNLCILSVAKRNSRILWSVWCVHFAFAALSLSIDQLKLKYLRLLHSISLVARCLGRWKNDNSLKMKMIRKCSRLSQSHRRKHFLATDFLSGRVQSETETSRNCLKALNYNQMKCEMKNQRKKTKLKRENTFFTSENMISLMWNRKERIARIVRRERGRETKWEWTKRVVWFVSVNNFSYFCLFRFEVFLLCATEMFTFEYDNYAIQTPIRSANVMMKATKNNLIINEMTKTTKYFPIFFFFFFCSAMILFLKYFVILFISFHFFINYNFYFSSLR